VIGWPSDLLSISKADADEFFATYYTPQNITLVLVGDFNPREVERLTRKYFERIPRGKIDPPDVVTIEMPSVAEKRMYAQAECNPQIEILWHTVPFAHKDSYALSILATLLSGPSGRLHRKLVLKDQLATSIWVNQASQRWAGAFNIGAEIRDGIPPEKVEEAIYEILESIKREGVQEYELQKAKNKLLATQYRKLEDNFQIMLTLLIHEGQGNWREVNERFQKLQVVTSDDVQRVAQTYFKRENRLVGIFTRKNPDN